MPWVAPETNSWYILIHTFSNASFVFLQILIGFSAARVFGGNEFLGGVIGMIMNHTALVNAWASRSRTTADTRTRSLDRSRHNGSPATGTAVDAAHTASAIMAAGGIPQVQLFGFYNVTCKGTRARYPVVIAVFIMRMLEKGPTSMYPICSISL